MRALDLNDIVARLKELGAYSPELSRRMDHEIELPEDAVSFLVERIETSFLRCEAATAANRADALDELSGWLIRSYRFYLARLATAGADTVWCFRFPKSTVHSHH